MRPAITAGKPLLQPMWAALATNALTSALNNALTNPPLTNPPLTNSPPTNVLSPCDWPVQPLSRCYS